MGNHRPCRWCDWLTLHHKIVAFASIEDELSHRKLLSVCQTSRTRDLFTVIKGMCNLTPSFRLMLLEQVYRVPPIERRNDRRRTWNKMFCKRTQHTIYSKNWNHNLAMVSTTPWPPGHVLYIYMDVCMCACACVYECAGRETQPRTLLTNVFMFPHSRISITTYTHHFPLCSLLDIDTLSWWYLCIRLFLAYSLCDLLSPVSSHFLLD